MKPRLIILSDLWGREKAQWIDSYKQKLQETFDMQYYDCCELAEVDKSIYTEDQIHKQFVNGGIELASQKLVLLEPKKVFVLAFSVGGTIAWKAAIKGLKFHFLYAISASRLRYQTALLSGNLHLHFGAEDPYKPTQEWFETIRPNYTITKNQGHLLYLDTEFINCLCKNILYDLSKLKQTKND
jgi:hypothetical protein